MKNCLKKVILLCLLFFPLMSITEGFTAGILVLTSTGYVPIENVRINDEVICLDAKMIQQHSSPPRIFASHDVNLAEHAQRALRNVFEIADGRRDDVQSAGHSAGHCGITGMTNKSPARS